MSCLAQTRPRLLHISQKPVTWYFFWPKGEAKTLGRRSQWLLGMHVAWRLGFDLTEDFTRAPEAKSRTQQVKEKNDLTTKRTPWSEAICNRRKGLTPVTIRSQVPGFSPSHSTMSGILQKCVEDKQAWEEIQQRSQKNCWELNDRISIPNVKPGDTQLGLLLLLQNIYYSIRNNSSNT